MKSLIVIAIMLLSMVIGCSEKSVNGIERVTINGVTEEDGEIRNENKYDYNYLDSTVESLEKELYKRDCEKVEENGVIKYWFNYNDLRAMIIINSLNQNIIKKMELRLSDIDTNNIKTIRENIKYKYLTDNFQDYINAFDSKIKNMFEGCDNDSCNKVIENYKYRYTPFLELHGVTYYRLENKQNVVLVYIPTVVENISVRYY